VERDATESRAPSSSSATDSVVTLNQWVQILKRQFNLKLSKAFIYKAFMNFHMNTNVPKANTGNGHLYSVTRLCPQLAVIHGAWLWTTRCALMAHEACCP
jgi:hypothetical protein